MQLRGLGIALVFALLAAGCLPAASAERRVYSGQIEGEAVQVALDIDGDGRSIRGTLEGLGESMLLVARVRGDGFEGRLLSDGDPVAVTGRVNGDELRLDIGPDPAGRGGVLTVVLRQASAVASARSRAQPAAAPTTAPTTTTTTIVNGVPLTEAEKQLLERRYRLRIGAGDYWYDRVSGAWGLRRGPTIGYILPGLALGGTLRADASGGGTMVVVNGRILHPFDLMALQMLVGPVLPGRYYLDSRGNAGFEGGPPLVNLVARVAALQQQQRQALFGPGWGGRGGSAGGGGDQFWSSGITGAAGNESNGAGYVMVDGVSATYGM